MNLREAAADAIATALAAGINAAQPQAAANCVAGDDDQEDVTSYPAIRVLTRAVEFLPNQEESVGDEDDPGLVDRDLVRVGDFEGILEIRVYHNYPARRAAVEQAVLDVLISREGAPGNFVATTSPVTVAGVATLHEATVSCFLDKAEWHEELVFEAKRMSFIELDFSYPALAIRDNAPTIEEIRLALEMSYGASDEVISIDEDGNLTPSS